MLGNRWEVRRHTSEVNPERFGFLHQREDPPSFVSGTKKMARIQEILVRTPLTDSALRQSNLVENRRSAQGKILQDNVQWVNDPSGITK